MTWKVRESYPCNRSYFRNQTIIALKVTKTYGVKTPITDHGITKIQVIWECWQNNFWSQEIGFSTWQTAGPAPKPLAYAHTRTGAALNWACADPVSLLFAASLEWWATRAWSFEVELRELKKQYGEFLKAFQPSMEDTGKVLKHIFSHEIDPFRV